MSIPGAGDRSRDIMPQRGRIVVLIALALIGLGAWRIFAVVATTPVLGYANQFDMRRTSACVGLWPAVAESERLKAHPEAPIARYVLGERRPDECYVSSELAFVAGAVAIARMQGGGVDLRVVGAIKAAALLLAALSLHALFSGRPAWALAHALVFALVIADPSNSLWLNTLYTEFSALFFAYVSIALLIAIAAREALDAPATPRLIALFAASLVGLGFSRQQHFLLPAVLALPAICSLWKPDRRAATTLLVAVSAIAIVQTAFVPRHPTIVSANNADVVLGAILPASNDSAATAERLGLPARCLRSVGATWYQTMGESLESTCPEVFSLPRRRILAALLGDPMTALRVLLRGAPQLQDWRLGYLGAVEGRHFSGAEDVRSVAGPIAGSIASFVTGLPPAAFRFVLESSLVLLVVSAVVSLRAWVRRRAAPLAITLFALSATAWYAIATAMFGDGYVEVSRHAQLAAPCLCAAAALLVASLFAPVVSRGADSRRTTFAAAVLVAAAAAGGVLSLPLDAAMATAPMAIGVVDRPVRNSVAAGPLQFSGWALEPSGVAAVELVSNDRAVAAARYGLPYTGARGEALRLYFPSYPNVDAAGFVAEVPASALAGGTLDVRTIVVGKTGARTEIDRRSIVAERN
jgi:hypothetical protein